MNGDVETVKSNAAESGSPLGVDPLVIRREDVGRHVFTFPELYCDGASSWLESPDCDVDTEVVIVLDELTEHLGYVHIRDRRGGDCKNTRSATMWLIRENRHQTFYATQEDAIRAALSSERRYARNILAACDKFEEIVDG